MPGSLAGQHRNRKAQANWKIKAHDAAFRAAFASCPAGASHSLPIFGLGMGEEISTLVILLVGSREASRSTRCTGSVRVLRNMIVVSFWLTLMLFRDWLRLFAACADRKSTRLNSSHRTISYAVFCLKK